MSLTDDDMLEVFVQESREHLESLEPDLLSLEDNPSDPDTINRIFRSVHSLKGTSGFFGLENISKLAHVMESLMSLARDGDIVLTPPMVDALLKGKDKLSEMVDDPQGSADMDISVEVALVQPFVDGDTPPAEQAKQAEAIQAETKEQAPEWLQSFRLDPKDFKNALDNNQRIYVLRLSTQKDIKAKNRTPLDFFNEIESLGEFLDSYTDLSPIMSLDNVLDGDLIFMFLFTAGMELDLVVGCFDIEPSQIEEVDLDTIKKIAALNAPKEAAPPAEKEPPKKAAPKKAAAPKPAPVKAPAAAPATTPKSKKVSQQLARKKAEETIRVSVGVLDDLMTLAGEMVLGRNQLMRLTGTDSEQLSGISSALQTINVVTTDLQEKVMQTRLQPIGSILGKFNRIIRDLGAKLNKEIDLEIQGKDVELDRSILEAISDPLTHLIRNCADHAIEMPDDRERNGKTRRGLVKLIARHAGGQVHVEIIDDGKGLDPDMLRRKAVEKGVMTAEEADRLTDRQAQNIIFHAGFSSAEKVSDVSGRGVGMDVVKTNIENLGGNVELDSQVGKGTRICLKLPLTLAIVPAMIVETANHRFAVPQVNLEEVVNLDGNNNQIERVRGTPVLRLRNKLLPLVNLREILDIAAPETEEEKKRTERYIMVLKTDQNQYGLIVDNLLNIEEIVVKPLSRYLQGIKCYSGATILGDGKVAVILDTTGVAELAELDFEEHERAREESSELVATGSAKSGPITNAPSGSMRVGEAQSLLIFRNSDKERFAINLAMVARIEKIRTTDIERIGNREYIKYLGGSLRLLRLHDFMSIAQPGEDPEFLYVLVPNLVSVPLGIIATEVIDAVESTAQLDEDGVTGKGMLGSAIIEDHLTIFVDVYSIFEEADPEHYSYLKDSFNVLEDKRILLAEDTSFFRTIVYQYLKEYCEVIDVAKDGAEAWNMLQKKHYDLLLTDIEMPHMDGFELTERVRASDNLKDMLVVALTALSSDRHIKRGEAAGVDAYETKLDKERLRETLERVLGGESKRLDGSNKSVIRAEPVA